MAKQWAVAPFQLGDKLPDNHLSPKVGETYADHYERCRAAVLYNDRPVIDGCVDSPQGESEVQF